MAGGPVDRPVHIRLLHAARELFSAGGYENATTSAIARQAGTSESQLIKHFGSKEGLLEAIFDEGWSRLEQRAREILPASAPPAERLRALAEVVIGFLEEDRRLRSLMLLESRRIRRHGHEVVISSGFRRFVALLDSVLAEIRQRGQMRADLNVQAVRSAWMGAIEGLLRDQLLAEGGDYPATFDSREMRHTFQVLLEAFVSPDPVRASPKGGA